MSAKVTHADRTAAHALFERVSGRECISNTDVHGVSCNDVVQAIADAREAENKACEAIASDTAGSAEKGRGYYGEDAATADAIADRIAARRGS